MKKLMALLFTFGMFCTGCATQPEITETETQEETEETTQSKYILNFSDETTTETTSTETETETTDETQTVDLDYATYANYQMSTDTTNQIVATFHIQDFGDIQVKLFQDAAPKAVENFVTHAKEGYYNGLTFHRVIQDFMIQSGDPKGDSTGGESIWGTPFENECTLELVPYRGALCMANQGTENSNTSQFFIVTAVANEEIVAELQQNQYPASLIEAYQTYGGCPWLYQGYTVFGQVVSGMDIADQIQAIETDENDKPMEDVIITSIDITEP